MSLNINVEYKCLGNGEIGHTKFDIDADKVKCVKDLKVKIEEVVNAPVTDQRLVYHSRTLNDDALLLKDLYLRDGDWLKVDFLAKANIPVLKELLKDLKDFSKDISGDQDSILKISFVRNNTSPLNFLLNYDSAAHALENLAFVFFIPWKNACSVAHRHYFVQEGGFDAFMNIFKFSHKRYRADDHENVQLSQRQEELLQERLKHFNNEQMVLQMHCLSLLWNFSETSHDRKLVLIKGGLQWVLDALLLNPHTNTPYEDEFWEIISINETAVGCLVQYAEFPKTQEIIARDTCTVNKLLFMVDSRLDQDTAFYSLYSSEIAANTLFCCTCSLLTPEIFVQRNVHGKMMELTEKLLEGNYDLALRYYCSLFLARIRASPFVKLDHVTNSKIDELLESFMLRHQPEEISRWEEQHNYVWVTMIPFVHLVFAGGLYPCGITSEEQVEDHQSQPAQDFVKQVVEETEFVDGGVATGSTVTSLKSDVTCDAGLLDMFGSHESGAQNESSSSSSISHVQIHDACSSIDRNVESSKIPVTMMEPQEVAAIEVTRTVMYGSLSVQRVGIYCLRHMLRLKENCVLIESENLLPYLVCLCWHLRKDEQGLLKDALRRFQNVPPPTLKVIAKSTMAMREGLESVYPM